ncbi:hypothetical protein YC2023_093390 [Brassica napus]
MANLSIFLSDLKPGRGSSTVQVLLLRFWKTRNVRVGGGGGLLYVHKTHVQSFLKAIELSNYFLNLSKTFNLKVRHL